MDKRLFLDFHFQKLAINTQYSINPGTLSSYSIPRTGYLNELPTISCFTVRSQF